MIRPPAQGSLLTVVALRRPAWRLAALAVLLLAGLAACSLQNDQKVTVVTIATVFPTTGPNAALGLAMQRAVELAVERNAALGGGYALTVTSVDEASEPIDRTVAAAVANQQVMSIVGPFDSQIAAALLPSIEQHGVATLSPGATLPGLTQSDQAPSEGISFAQLHPNGKPVAFFRLPETDSAAGKVTADLALAPTQAHGLAARSAFLVSDGSLSGQALTAAFRQELTAKGGSLAGEQSTMTAAPASAQAVVTAIIRANPDIVFYAGDIAIGAALRSTLSLTGAPQLVVLTAGPIADHPGWSAAVGVAPAAAYTTAVLPAQDLSALANAQPFVTAYHTAFPGQEPLPQSALAYDAAMDEIGAIKALIKSGVRVTRSAVLAKVASADYPGVTSAIAFDQNGDSTTPLGFSLYTCDSNGAWQYQTSLTG
jgi:branched-chain amino acid transport system substrate-binding protein